MNSTSITLLSICVTLLGCLVATVWKAAYLVRGMTDALGELRCGIAELKAGLEALKRVPLLEQRVEQLEKIVHDEVQLKLSALWTKVFSHDKHLAVMQCRQQSQHDINLAPEAKPDE
jgi:hypothetical protein